jgi:hypothetical protein
MAITEAERRPVGRPLGRPGTVRVLPTGVLRLSPDLCTAKTFSVTADADAKRLFVEPKGPFKLWYSSPRAKSGLLTIPSAFELLGIEPSRVAREYLVKLTGKGFVVELFEE